MKTKLGSLIVLCSAFATTAVFGQATAFTWTNSVGELGTAANWNPNGIANPRGTGANNNVIADVLVFNGQSVGTVFARYNTGAYVSASGAPGLGLVLSIGSSQASPVTVNCTLNAASPGFRLGDIFITNGAAAFNLGDTSTTNTLLITMGTLAGQVHTFMNDGAPATIYPNAHFQHGGGGAHTFFFTGAGNWNITNDLKTVNGSPVIITKDGSGTMTWTAGFVGPGNIVNSTLQGPTTINAGTLIIKGNGFFAGIQGNPNMTHNGALLRFDPGSGSDTWPFGIFGIGPIEVSSGTLTFSGANTFSGNIILSGSGELVASSTENVGVSGPLGQGGTISFNGGMLGFSVNNAFDYSPRFSTAASQAYSFDTAGQNVTFATGLSSSGGTLTKTNSGTLTLAGTSSYSGLTAIRGGKLAFQGPKTGSGDITVADGATLGVTDTGTPITPSTLTLGTSGSTTLEFDNVNSTTTAPLAAVNLSSAGTITLNVNSGTFPSVGLSYPLLSWTSGSAPAVSLGVVDGAVGNLSTNGNTIQLNITTTAYQWTGLTDSCWDTTTTSNWTQNGFPTVFVPNNGPVLFDDSAPGTATVAVCAPVQPTSITVTNRVKAYTIASGGGNNIAGGTGLTKRGSGTLTLSGGANTYTGVTTLRGGTVSVSTLANGGAASDIGAANNSAANLVFNGGALLYTGGAASIDRLFTVGNGGGTIDVEGAGALTLNNPGTVSLGGTLTLNGNIADTNILAPALIQSGGLNKSGTGTWVLTGNNSYGGGTVVANGVLQVGANGGTGSLGGGNVSIAAGTAIDFRRTGTLTVGGAISGNGNVSQNGSGTVILANNNTYSGGTTINAGTLQIGNGGSTGSLNPVTPIVNNSLVIFNTAGSFFYIGGGLISGSGNVIIQGGGTQKLIGANSYTGWTRIDAGSTLQPCQGNTGALVSSVVTNNGTLKFVRQDSGVFIYTGSIVGTGRVLMGINDFNLSDVTLLGTNTYTGGTFIGAGAIIFGDGSNAGFGSFVGNVTFVNNFDTADDSARTLVLNRPDDHTISGNITTAFTTPQNNRGIVRKDNNNTVTLTGNNNYASGTTLSAGTLVIGNGGNTGTLGLGNCANNAALVFNRANDSTFPGFITGSGTVAKLGGGTMRLSGTNLAYAGPTTISNGILVIGGEITPGYVATPGNVLIEGGQLASGGTSACVTNTIAGSLTIDSGSIVASLNRAGPISNTVYVVNGGITVNGGSLRLLNAGPLPQVNDQFFIFPVPVAGLSIVSPGLTVSNRLAIDGSVIITAVQPQPVLGQQVVGGTNVIVSWPAAWQGGVHLQIQTNSLSIGLSNNWQTVERTDLMNSYTNKIGTNQIFKASQAVFYRLIMP